MIATGIAAALGDVEAFDADVGQRRAEAGLGRARDALVASRYKGREYLNPIYFFETLHPKI